MSRPAKTCKACGRTMTYRKKWARNWDEVLYCSKRCGRTKPQAQDRALEAAILALLAQRARGASICPSEAARRVDADNWRPLMARTRMAARRLVDAQKLHITQGGRVVDPSTAKGPIRLRLTQAGWP